MIEIFSGTSFTAMRSIATKLVEKDELGKMNSLIGAAEAMIPLVYSPMYSFLYKETINTFPGAFYLVGSALITPTVGIFLYVLLLSFEICPFNILLSRWLYIMKKKDLKSMTYGDVTDVNNCKERKDQSSCEELESLNPKSVSINIINAE